MHAAMRPYATAGVALVGASVIAVSPIAPPPDIRIANPAVSLTAASIANVPANLINAVLNLPTAQIQGMQRFADAMESSGNWNTSQPNNVWGWDPANPEMLEGFVDMLVPFPALSGPLGEQLNWWAAANLPMYAGCAFECPDPIGMLNSMFRVPMWEFYDEDGYTFGTVINPIDGQPTEWSGQTVKLDPLEPFTSVIDYLMADPSEVTSPTPSEVITAVANLAAALQVTGQLPTWIAVREIETFLKLFVPAPETSIPAPDSARTLTLDVAALRADLGKEVVSPDAQKGGLAVADIVKKLDFTGGDAQQNEVTGKEVQSPDAPQDGLAVDGTATNAAGVHDPVSLPVVPDADHGLDTATPAVDATTAVEKPESTTATSTIVITDGNKVIPGQTGAKHRKPGGGLAGAVKSVQDTISKVTGGLTGGAAATTGGADTGNSNE
jgi:hypothetical protein